MKYIDMMAKSEQVNLLVDLMLVQRSIIFCNEITDDKKIVNDKKRHGWFQS